MVGCGQTSAKWLPSTMPSPPSTRLSGSRERRSSAFVREDSGGEQHRTDLFISLQPGIPVLAKTRVLSPPRIPRRLAGFKYITLAGGSRVVTGNSRPEGEVRAEEIAAC